MIKNFSLSTSNLNNFIHKLNQLDLSKHYIANVIEKKSKRSVMQNSIYWKFLNDWGGDTGNSPDDLHDYLREKYLFEIVDVLGQERKRLLSTTSLSTGDMSKYFEQCLNFAAEQGFLFESNRYVD